MSKWLLTAIFAFALFIRISGISNMPFGFTPDEASFGYDAYSILLTGKDQWGHSFPLVLESFGDFKPPLYAYVLIPFVAIFGLTEFAVRLPNAILGSIAVVVVYYLVKELEKLRTLDSLSKHKSLITRHCPLIAALFLAISPWHIMMSRGGFEANLTTFLMPLGVLLFFKGLNNPRFFALSAFVFGLNMFSYHAARFVTPLIVVALMFYFAEKKIKLKELKRYKVFLGVFLFFFMLNIYSFSLGAGTRVSDVSIFSGAQEAAAIPRLELINSGTNPTLAKIIQNKYTVVVNRFADNYSQYFSYTFLFADGPAEATYGMLPGVGVLYNIEILFVFGFVFYVLTNIKRLFSLSFRPILFLLLWLIVAPIPAALATGAGYAGNRSVIMLPALQIVLAIGAVYFFSQLNQVLRRRKYSSVFLSFSLVVVVFVYMTQFSGIYSKYVGDYGKSFAPAMLYGRRQMVEYLIQNNITPNKDKTVIDKRLSEPQMYIAFFMKINPTEYQRLSEPWSVYRESNITFVDQLDEYEMDEFFFTTNFLEKPELTGGLYVLVGKPEEFKTDVVPTHIIKYPDGKDAIYIVNPDKTEYAMGIRAFEISN